MSRILYAFIARYDRNRWRIRSQAGKRKGDYLPVMKNVLERVIKNRKHKRSVRTQNVFKCHCLVNEENNCYMILTREEYDSDLAYMFLMKCNRECSDTNKKYLKQTMDYWNETPVEAIKKSHETLLDMDDVLGEDSDEEYVMEKEARDDRLETLNVKKEMRHVEDRYRSQKKCILM